MTRKKHVLPPPPIPRLDAETARRFLSIVMDPEVGVTELRIFKARFSNGFVVSADQYSATLAGWYDSIDDLIADLGKLNGVSGYITINPVRSDLLARCANRIGKQKHTTTDADIVIFRWLYIDIDPRRPAEISATDAELAAAVEIRDRILADHPVLAGSSIWGKSGNGAWILVLLPDYLPEEGHDLAVQALAWISQSYSTDAVKIDVATKNPSRVGVIPGTVKCKGSHVTDRPHRLATLDSPDRPTDDPLMPFDLRAWLEHVAPKPPASLPSPLATDHGYQNGHVNGHANGTATIAAQASVKTGDNRIDRARAYLLTIPAAVAGESVSGRPDKHGHNQTFDAACSLIKGFDLSIEEARPLFYEWCERCDPPWSIAQMEHKLSDADRKRDTRPRGYLYNATSIGQWVPTVPRFATHQSFASANESGDHPTSAVPEGMEEDSHRLAQVFLDLHFHLDGPRLYYWREDFFRWTGTYFVEVPRKELRAELTRVIHEDFVRIYAAELMRFKARKAAQDADEDGGSKPRKPKLRTVTTRLVNDVIQALESITLLPIDRIFSQPAWLDGRPDWKPNEVLPAQNAIVHLPSFVRGEPCAIPPTPLYFNSYALAYDIGSPHKVGDPTEWLYFLNQLWPQSPDSIECLQEWFGYLLTADTSYQKILMVIGPPRSGKGTIFRVLEQLVGPPNVVHPILGQLAEGFGCEPLLGKPIAVVGDARIGKRSDKTAIIEKLLSISGEDPQTVGRKYIAAATVKLPTRFVILSNELPSLQDSSGAFLSRLIILQLTRSFRGQEDRALFDRLTVELPAILLWAIDGWKRLNERGRFLQPAMAKDLISEMETVSSPILTFIRECCVLDSESRPSPSVSIDQLYGLWKTWCQERDLTPSNKIHFARALHAAAPSVRKARHGTIDRQYVYEGIRLKTITDRQAEESAEEAEYQSISHTPF